MVAPEECERTPHLLSPQQPMPSCPTRIFAFSANPVFGLIAAWQWVGARFVGFGCARFGGGNCRQAGRVGKVLEPMEATGSKAWAVPSYFMKPNRMTLPSACLSGNVFMSPVAWLHVRSLAMVMSCQSAVGSNEPYVGHPPALDISMVSLNGRLAHRIVMN